MKKPVVFLTSVLLFVLVTTGCRAPNATRQTETPTFLPLPPLPTDPPTLVFASLTPEPASATATETPAPQLPLTFRINLAFEAGTVCGSAAYENEYEVTLSTDSVTMVQLNAAFTTTGPYDPVSGAFSTTIAGLPGTETYSGSTALSIGENGATVIVMNGEFGYGNDPNYCGGATSSQLFSGEASAP